MASTIKVDNVQNQPGTNIVSKCGTDITLGASGDTVALACGASQTGFGRTGTVDWQTGDIKTAAFIPAVGKGYFVNTTGGAITVNLPAGTAGDIVGLKDYANTWDSYAVTLNPNGSEKIGGGNTIDPTLTSEGGAVLLVYVDGTQGWLTTQQSVTTTPSGLEKYIIATGGTPCSGAIVCTNYKVHTFTGPGTFCVSTIATCATNNLVSYMVVAGGGGSGTSGAGGGGAGGYRELVSPTAPYTASPLDGYPTPGNRITVSATPYPIQVGGGGAGLPAPTPIPGAGGARGGPSIFSSITSTGGGGSPSQTESLTPTGPGGSGAGVAKGGGGAAGTGNTPPTTPAQGFDGGQCGPAVGGGGGGATAVGLQGLPTGPAAGGAGATSSIDGTPTARAGGGGGGSDSGATPGGGPGGGGGGQGGDRPDTNSTNGGCNTGGGAGGMGEAVAPGTQRNGGSGVVIIRYRFQ